MGDIERPRPGVEYPGTVADFAAWFPDDKACLDYLAWLRWGDEEFACHLCGAAGQGWQRCDGLSWDCAACGRRSTATSGTLFHRTRTPLTVWFRAAWDMTVRPNGVSARNVQRTLGLGSYQTAWTMLHRYRRAMANPSPDMLTGTIEVDEMFVGGKHKSGKPGRSKDRYKVPVMVAAEVLPHGIGRCRLRVLPDTTSPSMAAVVQGTVEGGSLLRSDAFGPLSKAAEGYRHERINVKQSGERAHTLFPAVSQVQSQAKRWLLGTLQGAVEPEHLQEYLYEFEFRFNRRHARKPGLLFYRLMEQAVVTGPVGYQDIAVGGTRPRADDKKPTPPSGDRGLPGSLAQPDAGRPWRHVSRAAATPRKAS